MDALSLVRRLTAFKPLLLAFIAFCAWPVVAGMVQRLVQHQWILMDIDAVLCGARTLAGHHSPYAIHPVCKSLRPAAFVYAPQVAQLFAPFVKAFGVVMARNLFDILILAPASLFLLWFALVRKLPGVDIRYRWLAFSCLTPLTLLCGNVGIVMHALILASLLLFPKTRWPFTLAVLACACVKPTFLAYFVIFLLDDMAPWRRLVAFGWRAALGLAVVKLIVVTDGHYGPVWQKTLHTVALTRQPGMGWFELTDIVFHVPPASLLNLELAGAFMVAMLLSGAAIAQWGGLDGDERLVLGMGLVPLMTPRILDYDMILVIPYAALLVACAQRRGGPFVGFAVSWLFVAWLVYGIVTSMMGMRAWHRTPMDMLLFGLLTAIAGLVATAHRLAGDRPESLER